MKVHGQHLKTNGTKDTLMIVLHEAYRTKSHCMSLTKNVLKETRVIYICWAEACSSSLVKTYAYILGQMHLTVAPLANQMQMCYLLCRICWSNCEPTKYGWTDFQKQPLIRLRSRPFGSVATHGFVMLLMNTENKSTVFLWNGLKKGNCSHFFR